MGVQSNEVSSRAADLVARTNVEYDILNESARQFQEFLQQRVAVGRLTVEEAQAANEAILKRLELFKESVKVQKESLALEQQRKFAEARQGLQGTLRTTGAGVRAGFTGRGAAEYERELLRSGSEELAQQLGELGQAIERRTQALGDAQSLATSINDSFKNAITVAILGGDVEQAISAALSTLGSRFLDIAFRPIEEILTQQLFSLFDPGGGGLLDEETVLRTQLNSKLAESVLAVDAFNKSLLAPATNQTATAFAGGTNVGSAVASQVASAAPSLLNAFVPGAGTALSVVGSAFGIGRAFGGFVAPGNVYPVGENGPELFVPGESGTIVDDPFAEVNAGLGAQPSLAEISSGDYSPGDVQVEYSGATLNFNGSEYVSKEDVPRIVNQAVKQSYGYTQNRLRSRPTDRRKLGMS